MIIIIKPCLYNSLKLPTDIYLIPLVKLVLLSAFLLSNSMYFPVAPNNEVIIILDVE